jgi:hypothetical protein
MTFSEYKAYFETIVQKPTEEQVAPYDNPAYIDYTRLNWSRMNRWFKTGKLSTELSNLIADIRTPQHWLIITEPWCGDAAHNIPFLEMAAALNPLVTVSYELRDSKPHSINSYLTNGSKSIPKLVVRDEAGNDLANWGPRPAGCQAIYSRLIAQQADFEAIKVEIQNWYNADKGVQLQQELAALLRGI